MLYGRGATVEGLLLLHTVAACRLALVGAALQVSLSPRPLSDCPLLERLYNKRFYRQDVTLENGRGQRLQASWYRPCVVTSADGRLPCVIYLHCALVDWVECC